MYSQQVRMYTLLTVAGLFSLYFLIPVMNTKKKIYSGFVLLCE